MQIWLQAAQWLGFDERDISDTQDVEDDPGLSFGQCVGLGYSKKKPSSKNVWKLEERLRGTLSQASKKRKVAIKAGTSVTENKEEVEEEEEEETGRSKAFVTSKVGPSLKQDLLKRPSRKDNAKKRK